MSISGSRWRRMSPRALIVALGAALAAAVAPASAGAFPVMNTWTGTAGGSPPTSQQWTNAGNWGSGALAAGESLSFPQLGSSGSYTSVNNETAPFSVDGISMAAGTPYTLTGNAITLGAGGFNTTTPAAGSSQARIGLPVALGADQIWNLAGIGSPTGGVEFDHPITGTSHTLLINMSSQQLLVFPGNFMASGGTDVGPLTISGANSSQSGPRAFMNGTVLLGGPFTALNAANAVNVNQIDLVDTGAPIGGPFTATGITLQVGDGSGASNQTATFARATTFDATSTIQMFAVPGTTAGTSYSQISGTNSMSNINLGNATLNLIEGNSSCTELAAGTTMTLVTTPGTLSGTFGGVPDGASVPILCSGSTPQMAVIHYDYTNKLVTATISGGSSSGGSGGTGGGSGGATTGSSTPATTGATGTSSGTQTTVVTAPTFQAAGGVVFVSKNGTFVYGTVGCPPSASAGCGVSGTATTSGTKGASASRKRKHKAVRIANASLTLGAGKSAPLVFALNAKGRSMLARAKHLKVTVSVKITTPGHSPVISTQTITLKAPRKKK